jgi:hypothetical protein
MHCWSIMRKPSDCYIFVYANSFPILAEGHLLHVAMWPLERGVVENWSVGFLGLLPRAAESRPPKAFTVSVAIQLFMCINIRNVDQWRSVGTGAGFLKLGSRGWRMVGSESWPLYVKRESFWHSWMRGQGGLQRQTVWTRWRKKPLLSSGLLTHNVRPVVLSEGHIYGQWRDVLYLLRQLWGWQKY